MPKPREVAQQLSTSPAGPAALFEERDESACRPLLDGERAPGTAVTSSGAGLVRPFDHGATSLRKAVV